MIWYNLSRAVSSEASANNNICEAELVLWIMEPSGNPPEAVYLTIKPNKSYRLLPLKSDWKRITYPTPNKCENKYSDIQGIIKKTSYNLQNGASFPIAKRLSQESFIPKELDKKYIFAGVVQHSSPSIDATIWVTNNSGENEHIGEISLKINDLRANTVNGKLFAKYYKKIKLLIGKCISRIALKLAKHIVRPKAQYFQIVNPERLGHLVANIDVFLSERKLGLYPHTQNLELYINQEQEIQDFGSINIINKISNKAFYSHISKIHKINVLSNIQKDIIERLWHHKKCIVHSRPHHHRDIHNALDSTPPLVTLTRESLERGASLLEQYGLKKPFKIALIHARNAHYTENQYKSLAGFRSERYDYRNVHTSSYGMVGDYLRGIGYATIQLGAGSDSSEVTGSPLIGSRQICNEDWFDLYVASISELFVGNTSGAYALADLFRKPIVFTNFAPLGHVYSWSRRHITIFKKLHDKWNNSVVPASAQLESELGWTVHMDKIDRDRYEYIDNTPDEILSVTREMVERLEGRWLDSEEDVALQMDFWRQLPLGYLHKEINSRIGSEYLRNNQWLLE